MKKGDPVNFTEEADLYINPLAFPVYERNISGDMHLTESGMTLRDYFANTAMQSVMIGEDYKPVKSAEEVAKWSYAIADAMLKQRLS